jgi:dienelactone hydrolase
MSRQLKASRVHRILLSPVGALLATGVFERLKMGGLPREFRIARARAAAMESRSVEEWIHHLGLSQVPLALRARMAVALWRFLGLKDHHARVLERWDEAFWGGAPASAAERVELEQERREASERMRRPTRLFRFLSVREEVPTVLFRIRPPEQVLADCAGYLDEPAALFAPPAEPPRIERSRSVPGPAGEEFLIRFASPSPFTRDTAYARVYEPRGVTARLPTFIFGSGLGMMNDLLPYWPEEEFVGRWLAERGFRVILPESPWHGRRELRGRYSGEPYLAGAPETLFQLYAAQSVETAVLIAWARSLGAPVVGVGGFSLGALVAQQVASRCRAWPEEMRPDMVFLGAHSDHLDEVVLQGEVSRLLGLTEAVGRAGWTAEHLARLRPLLDPLPEPGIDPERIVAVLGRQDASTPFHFATEMLDRWRVPPENRQVLDAGHMALYAQLVREAEARELLVRTLRRFTRETEDSPSRSRPQSPLPERERVPGA